MLKRVLIANRGEIALRVRRACREAGIETVSVYSQADAEALHVQLATRSVCIGPPRAADSYLNPQALLSAAIATGCDGLHPGYGFLSENPEFADACAENGITFIGPSGDAIRKAGSKSAARDLMRAAGVPVTPGSDGPVSSVEDALAVAETGGLSCFAEGQRRWRRPGHPPLRQCLKTCPTLTPPPKRRPTPASETTRCIWKSWCWSPGTSSFRS